jgi:hypothetical protein
MRHHDNENGGRDSDDEAVWVDPDNLLQSLIVGILKYNENIRIPLAYFSEEPDGHEDRILLVESDDRDYLEVVLDES